MRSDRFVYLAGPMTASPGHSIEENVTAGLRVYLALLQKGIPAFCPHLSGAFPTAWTLLSHDEWLAYDYAVIRRCSHVLMMPGWERSRGARLELSFAESIGVPVVFDVDALSKEA